MTKKELKQKMLDYLSRQDNYTKDEWYDTPYAMTFDVLADFAKEELNIDIGVE